MKKHLSQVTINLAHKLLFVFTAISINACQNQSATDATSRQRPTHSDINEQKLDHLLALMEERLSLAPKVAKSKWNSGSAVDDPQRESQILDEVEEQAELRKECAPSLVEDFFLSQMEAGKIIQKNLLSRWRDQLPSGYQFNDAPNLEIEIRPNLDRLTPELIAAFCEVHPMLNQPQYRHYLLMKANTVIHNHVHPEIASEVRRQAFSSLIKTTSP